MVSSQQSPLAFGPDVPSPREMQAHTMNAVGRHLRIVCGREGLQEIAGVWDEVTARLGDRRFFHMHAWYEAYLDTIEPEPRSVFFCLSYCDGRPEAIFPLRKVTRRICGIPIRILELPRHTHLHLADFVVPPDKRTPAMLLWLLKQLRGADGIGWDVMCLRNALEGSAASTMCRGLRAGKAMGGVTNSCKYLSLGNSFEDLQGTYSRKFRATLRTARNRLKRLGDAEFDVAATPGLQEKHYQWFIDVEASGWKGAGGTGTAIKMDERLTAFYRQLAASQSEPFRCEIFTLRNQDQTLAAAFCVVVDDTSYMLKIGYNEGAAHVSPAQMLVDRVTQNYIDTGRVRTLNFVSGVDWVDPWTKARYPVDSWYVFNNTLVGLAARAGGCCRQLLRKYGRKSNPATVDR